MEQDLATGIQWLVDASEEGNPHAAFSLGRVLGYGWGVPKDLARALAYYRLSAQRNFRGADIRVGDILRIGTGSTPPDIPESYANYLITCEAAIAREIRDYDEERALAERRITELVPTITFNHKVACEWLATDGIAQYGLLDFSLVNE